MRGLAGEFPSGQRGRAVNPLAQPSEVRILSPPPLDQDLSLRLGRTPGVKRLALAAVLVLAAACDGDAVRSPMSAQPTDWSTVDPGWTELAPPPYAASCAATAWTGRELLYWGGDRSCQEGPVRNEGAAFDAVTRTWRPLATAPIDGRSSAAAVWTGEELLVWGGWSGNIRADGAAYRPATDEWRLLSESPLAPQIPTAAVWTGREMLVWGGPEGAAYDPATDAWRELSPAPYTLDRAHAVWTGQEMIVYGMGLGGRGPDAASGLAYDSADDKWRELAPFPLSPNATAIVWTGRELVAWDYELRAGAYEPESDTWRRLPNLPLEFYECSPEGALAGESFVLAWHCGRAAILELATDTWRELPRPPTSVASRPIAADGIALFAGAWAEVSTTLWAYRPGPIGATAFVPPTERRGERDFLQLTFPDGMRVVLSYPVELDLAGMTVEPHVSYLYRDDLPPRFELDFAYGPVEPAPDQIAMRAGSWTVLADLRDGSEADTVARSLGALETADGFPVVDAAPPLALSQESGEGGGPSLTLDVVGERWLEVAVEPGCGLPRPEISEGHGAKCLGQLYLGVYGDRPFIEEVLEGVRIEDQ
jgi:hypothetical protein